MSGIIVNHLSKLSLSPWLRLNVHSFNRLPTRSCISLLHQKHYPRNLYSNDCNSLNPLKMSYRSTIVNNYSTDKKSESDGISSSKEDSGISEQPATMKVNQRTKLKQAVRDYGATIIVFHVAISLASLGVCYLAISNGVDAVRLLTFIGFSESVISSKVAVGGSTFVIAYAVHKVFAPVRIGITLSVAPFIVRYLRKINWLKSPVKKA